MKKNPFLLLVIALSLLISGCTAKNKSEYSKYTYEFLGAFDTVIQFMGYAKTQEDFEAMTQLGQARFDDLNKLYDIYNDYEGINNVKTINDNAGIKPVEVGQEIIDLILFSKEWYNKTNGKINIALGAMLNLWHEYREAGIDSPEKAEIPPIDKLRSAMAYTDLNKVIVDPAKKTVYLEDKNMRLDIGSVAKGYACELVAKELEAKGYNSFIISAGGNVRTVGHPLDGVRNKWGIGIQNPMGDPLNPDDPSLDIVYLTDQSVTTAGDYQRYYTVKGTKYHHIIDPDTLMPGDYFRSVTVVTKDSGVADYVDTVLFLMSYDEGLKLVKELGLDAIWVMKDGSIQATDNVKKIMKNLGGAKSTD